MTSAPPTTAAFGIGALNQFGGANSLYVAKVWNNIIYGYAVSGGGGNCIYAQNNGTVYAYNNTCVGGSGATNGITAWDNIVFYAKNNISIDFTDPYKNTFHADSTNNVSDTGDAPGSNPINGEPTFVNKAGNDYHLDSSDTVAQGAGANLEWDAILPITDDIDGDARPAGANTWDIGADEYPANPNSAPSAPATPYCDDNTAQSGQTNPSGVTDPTPAFSAIYNDPDSGDIANKYRVEVNTASNFGGTVMWDSGSGGTSMANTTAGDRCPDITYAGTALAGSTTYYWRITFWDDDDTEGTASTTQNFTTGTISTTTQSWGENSTRDDFTAVMEDTYLDQGQPSYDMGTDTFTRVGDDGSRINRTLIKYDLTALDGLITSASQIVSATLKMKTFDDPDPGNIDVDAFRVKKDWFEGTKSYAAADDADDAATWQYQVFDETQWTGAGCDNSADRETTSDDVETFSADNTWYAWDVTDSVKYFFDNPASNFGWLLKAQSEGTTKYWRIYSSEHATAANRPYLEITYNNDPACGYAYKRAITIDHNDVIGDSGDTVDLVDFPVVIKESGTWLRNSSYTGGRIENINGYDIIFKDSTETLTLAHEIEYYNAGSEAANGELVAWVKIPTLDANANTVIYMYYGNSCITDETQNKNAVWDTANGWRGVWHLRESTGTQCNDSTSNANHGTPSSPEAPDQVSGKFDGSLYFDDDNDANERNVLVTDANNSLDLPSAMTVSAWVKTADTETDVGLILMKWAEVASQKNYWLGKLNDTSIAFYVDDTENVTASLSLINDGTDFHQVVGVADPDSSPQKLRIYVDGIERNSVDWDGTSVTADADFRIGNSTTILQEFEGIIDEVRVQSTNRSAEWIATEYNNQNDASAFYGLGGEQSSGNQTPADPTINDHNDGSTTSDNTPTLGFTQADPDASEQVQYRIQIDATDNTFSNLVVDYTSEFLAEGATSFTVGQATGSGTYTVGSSGQTLVNGDYFWRVMTTDDESAESGWTQATSGSSVAFAVNSVAELYRSVGTTGTALESGTSNALTISGSTATFGSALSDNIGVGDVIEYDSNGDSSIDALAFIHLRIDSQTYTVKDKDGYTPTAVTGDNDWAIYRAYTSLANWESQTENSSITYPTPNDVNPSMDLVAANTIMKVPCYGDGEDTTSVYIDSWTTGPDNYIKIYTPVFLSEVGTSQRHNGAWDTSAYRISMDGSYFAPIEIFERYIRIEGLQIDSNIEVSEQSNGIQVDDGNSDAPVEIHISDCIIRMTAASPTTQAFGIGILNNFIGSNSDYVAKVWNNIIYGYTAASGTAGVCMYAQDNGTVYAYNNTCIGVGAATSKGISRSNNVDFYAKNNISIDSADPYAGTFHGDSTNNVSDIGDAPGSNAINGEPTFVDKVGNDYHLAGSDTVALGAGADLDGDAILPITDDIDGNARDASAPDIGADEYRASTATAIYYSIGTASGALYTGNASASSGTLTLLGGPAADKIGVGDEVREGLNRYYLTGRNSATEFTIQNSGANGGTPGAADITFGSTAIEIHRAFNLFSTARTGSVDANHLATADLVSGNFQLNWACYNDGVLSDTLTIQQSDWTSGPANYIKVYTPTASTEVGSSQRHSGSWGTGFRVTPGDGNDAIQIGEDYVRIEGISMQAASGKAALSISSTFGPFSDNNDVRISHCLIVGRGVGFSTRGAFVSDAKVNVSIWNTVAHNHASWQGFYFASVNTAFCYNCTSYKNINASSQGEGFRQAAGTVILKNCISTDNNYDYYGSFVGSSGNNISSDGTAPGSGSLTNRTATDNPNPGSRRLGGICRSELRAVKTCTCSMWLKTMRLMPGLIFPVVLPMTSTVKAARAAGTSGPMKSMVPAMINLPTGG